MNSTVQKVRADYREAVPSQSPRLFQPWEAISSFLQPGTGCDPLAQPRRGCLHEHGDPGLPLRQPWAIRQNRVAVTAHSTVQKLRIDTNK